MSRTKTLEKAEVLKGILKERIAILDISEIEIDYDTDEPSDMTLIISDDNPNKGEHRIGFCTTYLSVKDIDHLLIVREWTDHVEEFLKDSKI